MSRIAKAPIALTLILPLVACAPAQNETALVADPLEGVNRVSHHINRGVDTVVISPLAHAFGALPSPVETGLENFAGNLALPSDMVNNALQADVEGFMSNFGRFALNSTLGVGGLLDIATEAGLDREEADFGQTLALWGAGEGAYLELPLLGPGTVRSHAGAVIDALSDPLNAGEEPDTGEARLAATGITILSTRDEQRAVIDRLLYQTEDSYAALRDTYIQNRRAQLGGTEARDDGFIDLYDEN
ncbi:MlaA family lipoprotein [Pontivivens insulae]|uniref:Putative phospholipid-binding lipoprotein MlaA n=1 Tax=Pontivivens insulae TaxID=1639689 RepID=A0A2R8AEN5_9RHOB|nr:VacJ family lipoprotein [Pontivivens insulae]RED11943.1 phospholipid-binding lipoprotein MlaA [Pontivivens insulae]SPF30699.1 putative phospholipid-binding lipoprotein MlaA [Pontivivens insulae]